MARRSPFGAISPEVRVEISLAIISGVRVVDMMIIFKIGNSTCILVFNETMKPVNYKLSLPVLPSSTSDTIFAANNFRCSRRVASPLHSSVCAIEGIALKIQNPSELFNPRDYFCRKGFCAISLQAVVDSSFRF